MQRALVIRVHGNQEIGQAIVSGMESPRLKELEARLGVKSFRDSKEYLAKIEALHANIPIREHSPAYHKFWSCIAMIWLMLTEY